MRFGKIQKFNKKNWLFLGVSLFLLFVIIFYFSAKQIGTSVSQICSFAQNKYRQDCVTSLILVLDNKDLDFSLRNRAIWALGQLGDKRSLPSLNNYILKEAQGSEKKPLNSEISQYELKKAIKLVSGSPNITAWLWRDGKFFQEYTGAKMEDLKENSEVKLSSDVEITNSLPQNHNKVFKLLFFGDLMLDRHVAEKIDLYSLDKLLSKLNETNFTTGYDVVGANLEGAVTNQGAHYRPHNLYDFAFKPETVNSLKGYGFNFFTVANNHLADQGLVGVEETYENLSSLGLSYVGCQDGDFKVNNDKIMLDKLDTEAVRERLALDNCSFKIVESDNGQSIGFLAFSIVYRSINENEIVKAVKDLKKEVDWLIVLPHWGIEYESLAAKSQNRLAKKIIDSGADAIIGSHPHVIQNYEIYKGKPIFYSLGNFIFDQYFSKETQEGLAVALTFKKDKQPEFEIYKIITKGSFVEFIEKQQLIK
ncbi:MAG: CapA family protein [Candidatus Pacebacteria bacterium]|nr:CapA family protein [Candidatus Paceibacterota bacterium]